MAQPLGITVSREQLSPEDRAALDAADKAYTERQPPATAAEQHAAQTNEAWYSKANRVLQEGYTKVTAPLRQAIRGVPEGLTPDQEWLQRGGNPWVNTMRDITANFVTPPRYTEAAVIPMMGGVTKATAAARPIVGAAGRIATSMAPAGQTAIEGGPAAGGEAMMRGAFGAAGEYAQGIANRARGRTTAMETRTAAMNARNAAVEAQSAALQQHAMDLAAHTDARVAHLEAQALRGKDVFAAAREYQKAKRDFTTTTAAHEADVATRTRVIDDRVATEVADSVRRVNPAFPPVADARDLAKITLHPQGAREAIFKALDEDYNAISKTLGPDAKLNFMGELMSFGTMRQRLREAYNVAYGRTGGPEGVGLQGMAAERARSRHAELNDAAHVALFGYEARIGTKGKLAQDFAEARDRFRLARAFLDSLQAGQAKIFPLMEGKATFSAKGLAEVLEARGGRIERRMEKGRQAGLPEVYPGVAGAAARGAEEARQIPAAPIAPERRLVPPVGPGPGPAPSAPQAPRMVQREMRIPKGKLIPRGRTQELLRVPEGTVLPGPPPPGGAVAAGASVLGRAVPREEERQ